MGRAVIEVSYSLLKNVLLMPPNTNVLRVRHSETHFPVNCFEVIVAHPDLPETAPGDDLPHVHPAIATDEQGDTHFDWGVDWSR